LHQEYSYMGPAGFEPATSSARGWHPAKLDNGPPELHGVWMQSVLYVY
jgi:hypothetical protein